MDELISKQAAIEAINLWLYCDKDERMPADVIKALPTVQPTITHEQAIDYLHKTGWLQNHDRILTESKIVPTVQPKRGKWIPEYKNPCYNGYYKIPSYCSCCKDYYTQSPEEMNFCPHCGADMRTKETDCDYERAVEQLEHDMLYEPTFDPDDGSM